ncbi:hypothetical protein AAMO2058_000340500 [Amorphochlora amoebiformis]
MSRRVQMKPCLLLLLTAPLAAVSGPSPCVLRRLRPLAPAQAHVARLSPFSRPTTAVRRRVHSFSSPSSKADETLSFLDALCDVDTGEGCPVDTTEAETVEVALDIGDGRALIPAVFELSNPGNTIETFDLDMPLGIIFEDDGSGVITVAEISESGAAARKGVQIGDKLRATSCVVQKKRADFTYWVGGVGDSGKQKALFQTDRATFPKAMAEIRSNSELDGRVVLVLERAP